MPQPTWITPAGSLGVIPEGIFYRIPVQATAGEENVYFRLIAGQLPSGIQVTTNGFIEGVPKTIATVQGVPLEVSADITSKFAIRAYTQRVVNGQIIIDRLADRTFTLTVTGQDIPDFVTPAGNVGTYYDGTEVSIQIEISDNDPDDTVVMSLLTGALPPGLVLSKTGLITGVIRPLVGPPGTAEAGYDDTPKDAYPNDFTTRSTSKNYQFTLQISDGKDSNIRTFEIFVYSKDSMSADTTDFTADNTFITADVVPTRTPILLTPTTDLGRVRGDNFYAYKFEAIDFDGDAVEYSITVGAGIGFDDSPFDATGIGFDRGTFSLPPGLSIDPETGWFYGYIPDQGATETEYRFAVRVYKSDYPTIISDYYYFTITIIGNIDTEVTWLTPPNLGTINNGAISMFNIEAINTGGRSLQYRLVSGSDSKLPQGLTLLPSGDIVGRVSFNTFALDGGTTTFDKVRDTRLDPNETTFDSKFEFDVNAFAPQSADISYEVSSIVIINGGFNYTVGNTSISISAPPPSANSIQATAGIVTVVGGAITEIEVGNPGRGYTSPPTITITGDGFNATAVAQIIESRLINAVSVVRRFTITVNREFNAPYESLYIKAMPPESDRALLNQLLQSQEILPESLIYRSDDPNFGVAKDVSYTHAFGLTASNIEDYVASLSLNHYWKNLVLGELRTAQALDANGRVVYEVVYSEIIDNLVNAQGESVGKEVTLPYPVIDPADGSTEIDTVYPNSLINMRDQVIDTVGQVSPALPLWMTSKQTDGRVPGFVPAWVICYTKPGQSNRIKYNIETRFGINRLNLIDYKVDRYELDRSQSYLWDPTDSEWIPSPPQATTFDLVDRPSNLDYIGEVDYATTLSYSEIDYRTLDEIARLGGIDGVNGRQLNGRTLIFIKQEGFDPVTPNEAFTKPIVVYDQVTRTAPNQISANLGYSYVTRTVPNQVGASISYDVTGQNYDMFPFNTITDVIVSGEPDPLDGSLGTFDVGGYDYVSPPIVISGEPDPLDGTLGTYDVGGFDTGAVIPQPLRLAIYRMNVSDVNQVTLELVETTQVNDYVKVTRGVTYNNTELYLPNAPGPGLTLRTWSYIPEDPTTPTIFDGGSTRFIAPADRWTDTDEFDKYLVFPKINILG